MERIYQLHTTVIPVAEPHIFPPVSPFSGRSNTHPLLFETTPRPATVPFQTAGRGDNLI